MNDDLKAYVDGELPPDAAEWLRVALESDPVLKAEANGLRGLSTALRDLPEHEPVGRAATLAALAARRPLWRIWTPALAGCAAVVAIASGLAVQERRSNLVPALYGTAPVASAEAAEATIPAVRREAFERYVRALGGQVRRDGDGLRAFYPPAAHEALKRRFLLPERTAWPTDGLRVRIAP